jgi:hypothetical protein
MVAAALWLVASCGSNVPIWDDLGMVPTITNHQPIAVSWLWSQHNEHRAPVPRLLYLGLIHFPRPQEIARIASLTKTYIASADHSVSHAQSFK